jgi:charged multivesicular body protein 4
MSGVWGWFGGGAAKKDKPKDAILGLRSHLEMLHKRADFLTAQVNKETAKAKENVSTNKAGTSRPIAERALRAQSGRHGRYSVGMLY